MLIIVVIKFIAPSIEEIPAKCKLKMTRSTDPPPWDCSPERGGYTVHPVPAPASTKAEASSSVKAGGNNQKLMLFSRGNAMSGAPIDKGTNQLPNPPIITGMTKKKIMTKACAVTITLYKWSSPNIGPGPDNSKRINTLKAVPTIPANPPNSKYRVPISLWLVE